MKIYAASFSIKPDDKRYAYFLCKSDAICYMLNKFRDILQDEQNHDDERDIVIGDLNAFLYSYDLNENIDNIIEGVVESD